MKTNTAALNADLLTYLRAQAKNADQILCWAELTGDLELSSIAEERRNEIFDTAIACDLRPASVWA